MAMPASMARPPSAIAVSGRGPVQLHHQQDEPVRAGARQELRGGAIAAKSADVDGIGQKEQRHQTNWIAVIRE
jgi:hypothetical protein